VCRRSREGLLVCDGCQPFTRESQVLSGASLLATLLLFIAPLRFLGAPRWMLAVFVTGLIADLSWRSVAGPLDAPAVALLAAQLCVTVGWAWLLLTSARVSRTFVH
jgi:hypothetical protein